jgi:uncharacterized membrane protein
MIRFLAAISLVLLAACSSSDAPSGPSAGTGGSSGAPSDSGSDTWSSFAQGFFATYCVSCHDGTKTTNGSPIVGDFRNLADVMQHKTEIRCGVATSVVAGCEQSHWPPKQFPVGTGPKPTDEERSRVVAWIEAGLP